MNKPSPWFLKGETFEEQVKTAKAFMRKYNSNKKTNPEANDSIAGWSLWAEAYDVLTYTGEWQEYE